jgi:hypothetical protein
VPPNFMTRMGFRDMDTPGKQKAPRGVRGAGSEGRDSGQVPRTAVCVVLIPMVLNERKVPSPPMRAIERERTFIGNNM